MTLKQIEDVSMKPVGTNALDNTTGNVSSASNLKAMRLVALKKTDGRKQSIDKQIADLKAAIDKEQAYIMRLIATGQTEKSIARMRWQVQRHDRINELAIKYQSAMAAQAMNEVFRAPLPSKIKVERKVKRYARFSDK